MPTGTTLTPPTQTLPDTPAPKRTLRLPHVQPSQISVTTQSCHALELLFSPPAPHTGTPSIQLQSAADHDSDAESDVSQSIEDEYTLSAYGDISLSEVVVPPLPAPTHPSPGTVQPGIPQPRLRLKVQRPPMPKRRLSYYAPNPMPRSGGMKSDERWPYTPRPFANSQPWTQLPVSPPPVVPTNSRTQWNEPVKKSGSSLEKLFDELLPRSPSVRLSPPGSPASQALSPPQETCEQKTSVQQGRNPPEADDEAKLPQFPPARTSWQDKPKSARWRTKLPPRLPIPQWDV